VLIASSLRDQKALGITEDLAKIFPVVLKI
jgi:hypothetical protein